MLFHHVADFLVTFLGFPWGSLLAPKKRTTVTVVMRQEHERLGLRRSQRHGSRAQVRVSWPRWPQWCRFLPMDGSMGHGQLFKLSLRFPFQKDELISIYLSTHTYVTYIDENLIYLVIH